MNEEQITRQIADRRADAAARLAQHIANSFRQGTAALTRFGEQWDGIDWTEPRSQVALSRELHAHGLGSEIARTQQGADRRGTIIVVWRLGSEIFEFAVPAILPESDFTPIDVAAVDPAQT